MKGEDKRLEEVKNEMSEKGSRRRNNRSSRLKDFVKQAQLQIKRLKKLKQLMVYIEGEKTLVIGPEN